MKLFLDSANLADIQKFIMSTAIKGVTTNPSLVAKEKVGPGDSPMKKYSDAMVEIAKVLDEVMKKRDRQTRDDDLHLSVEVISLNPGAMLYEAETLLHDLEKYRSRLDVYVKVPVLLETLPVITELARKNVQVNATAVMTAGQAKLAEDAGAKIVSFFYNRIIDGGGAPMCEIGNYTGKFRAPFNRLQLLSHGTYRAPVQVIAGSIRKPDDVLHAWEAGADIVTASAKVIGELLSHPETDKAVNQFKGDIESWLK